MPQTAKATVTVTVFRQVATTLEPKRYCAVEVDMRPLQPPSGAPAGAPADIVFVAPSSATHPNGRFHFNAPGALALTIKPRDGINATYVPLAVGFRRSTECPDDCDVLGRGVLASTINDDVVTIRNKYHHPHQIKKPVVYEFYILIQRSSDGAIGLIDPDIENKEEE
jgi:hypothetical protein